MWPKNIDNLKIAGQYLADQSKEKHELGKTPEFLSTALQDKLMDTFQALIQLKNYSQKQFSSKWMSSNC